jgi:hypothetical protein
MSKLKRYRVVLALCCYLLSFNVMAATIPVVNGNNDGAGSLRQAINAAQNGDVIVFQGPIVVQLSTGALYLDKSITITGVAGARITRAGSAAPFRLLFIDNTLPRSGVVRITNIIFSDGNAGAGSAILNVYPSLEIVGCTFENNTGSALASNVATQYFEVRNCIFKNNIQSGFEIVAGTATIIQSDFFGNGISGSGGAIIANGGAIHLQRCTIRGNKGGSGGGVVVNATTASMVNCAITGNRAATAGGGIYIGSAAAVTLHSSTISGNVAPAGGGARLVGNSTIAATNTILWGNSTELALEAGSSANIQYSIVQGGFAGTGNLNLNPAFVTPLSNANPNPEQGGNFQLTSCSPAINAGTSTNAPAIDLIGSGRPQLGAFDMGAYESASAASTGIVYVLPTANGNNTGSSWTNAFTTLQAALAYAAQCQVVKQVWVAKGTYYPDEGPSMINNDRNMRFSMRNGLAVYGGFGGTETLLSQRNLNALPSILSGEIQQDNDAGNNTNGIFSNLNLDPTAVLDGFTVQSGASTGSGGAMVNNNSSPTIRNCIFKSNTATSWAGAVYNAAGSNPVFINCIFTGNSASVGGVIFNSASSPVLINCTIAVNQSPSGSAIWSQTNSFSKLTNCIVWGNTGSVALINTVTSPYTVSYSITQEAFAGVGNLTANPLFINADQGNFRLTACSPAINTGTAMDAPVADILGAVRTALGGVDMGAYERHTNATANVYVDSTAAGHNDGSSWANAYTTLGAALSDLNNCVQSTSIHMAKGTYTAPGLQFIAFDKLNAQLLGGYPSGGGTRNAAANPVIIKGNVRVLKNALLDGVRVQQAP